MTTPEGAPMRMTDAELDKMRNGSWDCYRGGGHYNETSVVRKAVAEIDRLRSLAAVRSPVDEGFTPPTDGDIASALVVLCEIYENVGSFAPGAIRGACIRAHDTLSKLSASYSAACGERDAETFRADDIAESRRIIVANHREALLRAEAAEHAADDLRAQLRGATAAIAPLDAIVEYLGIADSFDIPLEVIKQREASALESLSAADKTIDDLRAQLSLALVERDRARTDALEEAAKLCIAIRDANFANLPDYENEPDFSTEDVCGEDVCAWHIRAAKARPAIKSPAPIPAQETDK